MAPGRRRNGLPNPQLTPPPPQTLAVHLPTATCAAPRPCPQLHGVRRGAVAGLWAPRPPPRLELDHRLRRPRLHGERRQDWWELLGGARLRPRPPVLPCRLAACRPPPALRHGASAQPTAHPLVWRLPSPPLTPVHFQVYLGDLCAGFHIGIVCRWDNRAVVVRGAGGAEAQPSRGRLGRVGGVGSVGLAV